MNPTTQQVVAALEVIEIVAEAIETAGTDGIPNGHLYAMLQSINPRLFSYSAYTSIIEKLVDSGVVSNRNHLLVYISKPSPEVAQ